MVWSTTDAESSSARLPAPARIASTCNVNRDARTRGAKHLSLPKICNRL